jgi:hypothetical protein
LYCLTGLLACKPGNDNSGHQPRAEYASDTTALHTAIAAQDSIFFAAYNRCDLEKQAAIYDDSIEFYHDKGGLSNSKEEILEGTRKYVCGRTTRELVKGSIEVYPINNYGAIEIGEHIFHNSEEPNAPVYASKFIIFWKGQGSDWKIKRVVSLH